MDIKTSDFYQRLSPKCFIPTPPTTAPFINLCLMRLTIKRLAMVQDVKWVLSGRRTD
ncbi:MAG: hypothetical protein ACRC62_09160 [Microcoleus sp.]